ncbi:general amidase [Penicillium malachiteum]|uniref:general amidase n=1 Tax=Penicillium malachiteum TaxID=1324776 RepID=UPI0025486F79|nr:general amidase [Penicillium malachiteum]KAJ5714166.1 general amidase [Penicillium malachiteum]
MGQIITTEWQTKAQNKRASLRASIPEEWRLDQEILDRASKQRDLTGQYIQQYLEPEEIAIIGHDSTTIVENIRNKKWTSLQVAKAFCKTAAISQQLNNCLHEIFISQALQRAEELDAYLETHGTTVGPLHGLPISLKDQFYVKGIPTSMGYIGWLDTYEGDSNPKLVHKVESQIVGELLSLGAVLYCKFGETVNNIIGQTLNPVNQNLSCGGSSGGEGALQALRGSSVGLGTDIGGSVRIPAAFCGTFSLKPTHDRLSYRNVANVIPGETTYPSSVGVMGTSIDALRLVLSSILSTEPWLRDPVVVPIPWREKIAEETLARSDGSTPLKLGIFWTDDWVTPHPPVQRALRLIVKAVKGAGHKVVEWTPPSQKTAKRVHVSFLKADSGYDINKQLALSGEPLIPQLRDSFTLHKPMSLLEYQALTTEGRDYEAAYSDYWNSTSVDDAYSEAINLMDYSAVVIPVTKADKEIDQADKTYEPLNDLDAQNWEAYEPEIYHGAPVGLQIVARKYEEEKVWAIGKIVSQCLEGATA